MPHTAPTSSSARSVPSVAIVGAGPGGLASAVLLASSGVHVTVYEAAAAIGGRTAHVHAGPYRFDSGPTFFMMPYVLDEVFAAAGTRLADEVELTRLDPMYRLVLGRSLEAGTGNAGGGAMSRDSNIILDATQNIEEMSRRLSAINPRDGDAFKRFINDNRKKLQLSESILRNPMRSPLDLFSSATWKDTLRVGPILKPWQSVHDQLGEYFEHPQVRLAVSFQSKYLGMSPFECPSLFTILPFIEYEYGIWHPKGGCHELMQALARVAVNAGATIHCGAPVEGVEFDTNHKDEPVARGVVIGGDGPLAGTTPKHDFVVLNADATHALQSLIPASVQQRLRRSEQPEQLNKKKYSCSTAMLYLGVDGEVQLPHHTIYVSANYEQNLRDICGSDPGGGRVSEDPSVYVCNPSRIDPTLAPKGKSSIYLLIPTPNCDAPIDWAKAMPAYRALALQQVADQMGVDLRGRIEQEVVYTPDTWKQQRINKGATFNLAHNLGQMLHWRPQNHLAGLDNVYLVGGGTHPGSGLPTIFLSAQISTRMICDRLGISHSGVSQEVSQIATSRRMRDTTTQTQQTPRPQFAGTV